MALFRTIRRRWVIHGESHFVHKHTVSRYNLNGSLVNRPWKRALCVSLLQNKKQLVASFFTSCALSKTCFLESTSKCVAYDQGSVQVKFDLWASTVEAALIISRAAYLFVIFSPAIILASFVEYFGGHLRTLWLRLLLTTLQNAGPVFIKWGQWASSRPDIFPPDVCDCLSILQNQAPGHSFEETRQIVESAFNSPLEDVFESFSHEPEASGSIAQVHRATLKRPRGNGGQTVAVKVRHPCVLNRIKRDFYIIECLARVSTLMPGLKHLQLDKTVHQFAAFMTQQVDLSLEAVHLMRFRYNFRKVRDVSFPEPKYPFVHPAVLVEAFEEGESVANYITEKNKTRLHTRIAELGTRAVLKMLLEDNFIHGDLHPGNVLVRVQEYSAHLVLVDAGMTAELNQTNSQTLLELFQGVAERDGCKVAECTLAFSKNQTCPDPEKYKQDVDSRFRRLLGKDSSARSTGECMMELFDAIRRHRVNIDGDVCTVMVTTIVLEGWQRKLDPDFDILNVLGSLLENLRKVNSLEYVMLALSAA